VVIFPHCLKHTTSRSIALAGTGFSALTSGISAGTCFYIAPQDTSCLSPPLKAGTESLTNTSSNKTSRHLGDSLCHYDNLYHVHYTDAWYHFSYSAKSVPCTFWNRYARAQTRRILSASSQDATRVTHRHFNRRGMILHLSQNWPGAPAAMWLPSPFS